MDLKINCLKRNCHCLCIFAAHALLQLVITYYSLYARFNRTFEIQNLPVFDSMCSLFVFFIIMYTYHYCGIKIV